ncbi:ferric reductase like transmembrane component-domain-containing protein, partial [Coniochaeta sp. 2T2.1]
MWLNVTSLANSGLYSSNYGTLGEFAREEALHSTYALIICFVLICFCIVAGVLVQIASTLPGAQKQLQSSKLVAILRGHIILPALFGTRRLEPLPGNTGYVPGRVLSISIALYVALNIIFSAVSFRSFQPNAWFMSTGFELCEYVGNRAGVLSLANMAIAILFAGRNHLLLAITGWSQTTFLTLHRWAARVATVQAVVHSVVYTLAYFEPGYDGASAYAAKAAEPFYYWGIIATIAMCITAGSAFLPLRINFYETFLALHIALVVLTLAGCWYHIVPHFGFDFGYEVWLYIAFAFWAADRLARFARVAFYNGVASSKAVVEAVHDTDVLQITVFPRTTLGFGPGQHTFLYIGGLGKFWENHPFSVAGWTKDTPMPYPATFPRSQSVSKSNTDIVTIPRDTTPRSHSPSLRFLVRVHSGATATLQRRLGGSRMEIALYNEGPYGGHRATLLPLSTAETVLCLVGGIGITNALGYVQEYATMKNLQRQAG